MTSPNAPLAVFAHPGHELRILHALGALGASCLYLTDASGSTGVSRLPLTTDLLADAGLPGRIPFPFIADAALYAALMTRDEAVIDRLRRDLSDHVTRLRPAFLITDSAEGYNPAHDLCHFVALELGQSLGVPVYDIALDGDPGDFGHARREDCRVWSLDGAALARKLAFVRDYAALAGHQLAGEAKHLLARYGDEAQAKEILRPALGWRAYDALWTHEAPFFERHGLKRVREGKYTSALTYRDHLRPVLAEMMVPA
jgi:LmbE family N-acetylglucosaminyl deacetylase